MNDRESGIGNRESDELPAELRQALERLDREALAAANRLDVEQLSAGVLGRLKSEPHAGTPVRRYAMRIAAAVALIVAGTATGVLLLQDGQAPDGIAGLPVTLDSLSVADSVAVLSAVEEVRLLADSTMAQANDVSVDDLDEQELRALLQAMESEESL